MRVSASEYAAVGDEPATPLWATRRSRGGRSRGPARVTAVRCGASPGHAADLQHPPRLIPQMLDLVLQGLFSWIGFPTATLPLTDEKRRAWASPSWRAAPPWVEMLW